MARNAAELEMVRCPECKASVRADRLSRHLTQVHAAPRPKGKTPATDSTIPSFVRCPQCKNLCTSEGLQRHLLSHSDKAAAPRTDKELRGRPLLLNSDYVDTDPLGVKVLKALERGQRYLAAPWAIARCEECKQQVIVLEVGDGIIKSFDVGLDRVIACTHACEAEARSTSIRAYSGGAIDSNRRRH